ncbi:MAG: RuvX/YqgF family protein [Candidatus Shapirobacteria bacterium]
MNYLSIDYGTKRVGFAYTVNNIIFTLPQVKNDEYLFDKISNLIKTHTIGKIYVGMSQGKFAKVTQNFVDQIQSTMSIPVETVEEAVSTIEAHQLKSKDIDSVSAAIILNRAIGL